MPDACKSSAADAAVDGVFGAWMTVELVNGGPVTIVLD
jgi:D-Tyr-tRNAtyr deacylase